MSNFDPRALGMYRARQTQDTCAICQRRPEPKPGALCAACEAYCVEQPKRRRKEAA